MIRRIWMIVWKEFLQIRRDPRMLGVTVILPIFMVILYGYAINLDVRHLRLGILDNDRTTSSRQLLEGFTHNEYFLRFCDFSHHGEIEPALVSGLVKAVLIIPRGFSETLTSNREATVQILIDGSDSTTANTAIGYVHGILAEQSARVTLAAVQRVGSVRQDGVIPIENRFRNLYNPELRSANFIIPGLIAVILMMLSALLTSVTVVRERERGTIEQLIVSPVTSFELMIGKLIPYVLIAYGDVVLVVMTSVFLFAVPLKGNLFLLFALSGVFLTAALGVGLFISVKAPNQQIANMGAMVGTQLPAVLLSGFMFPITSMPESIRWVTNLIPATHFISILRGLFLKGNDLAILQRPTLILLGFAFLLVTLSALSFKKRL